MTPSQNDKITKCSSNLNLTQVPQEDGRGKEGTYMTKGPEEERDLNAYKPSQEVNS